MKLSLVTGTLNRHDSFKRLVDSIVKHTSVPWELVVSDASDVPVECSHPNVRILPERPRQTCVKGYNRAFRESRGEWVIYLNDDAEVQPGYAEKSIRFMEAHPSIGLGALYYQENENRLPGSVYRREPSFCVNTWAGMIYANFGILRRSFGDSLGWFDDDLTMYGNDNSLACRTLLAGYGIAPIPGSRIVHHVVLDRMKLDNQKFRKKDGETFLRKYAPYKAQMQRVYGRNRHLIGPLEIPVEQGVTA